ncbi:MAG TPA: two-component regulator propeller domain-containing protein, partial [Anaerolineae bacterium]
ELGPAGDRILALALDRGGRPWIGTEAGAAHFDGEGWQPVPAGAPGLLTGPISALAVSPGADGEVVWFGGASGAAAYDTGRRTWLPLPAPPAGPDGITCLLVDAEGRAWAGTGSRGLWLWGPAGWTTYTSANANLPLNSVSAVFESAPGRYWIGTAFAIEQPGGLLSTFDGKDWQTYGPGQTGYSGGEVTAMARDAGGRLWLATRTRGIDIYQIPNR